MLRHIAAFEWRYQLKSTAFLAGCALFFLLTFGSITVDQIQIGSRGNVHLNAPFAILQTLGIMSVFGVLVVTALVADVVIRDDETGFAPILRSTPISKASYLGGRFVGASAAALVFFAVIPLAVAVGSVMPWLDPEKVGPFRPGDYLYALFFFGLPTVLVLSACFFALATATRSMMWTYVGAVALIVLYLVMRGLLRDPRHDTLVALADPFGLAALSATTKYWTASERNTQLPAIGGLLLANRLLWAGVSAACFAVAYRVFRVETRGVPAARKAPAADEAPPPPRVGPLPAPQADAGARLVQLWRLARFDLNFVFRSPAFFVLLGIGVINALAGLTKAGEHYGSGSYPVTRLMVGALQGSFAIIPILISIYYSGELIWRDRDRQTSQIVDATAAPDWVHLVPKIVAVLLVLASTAVVAALTGVGVQLARGYHQVDLPAYALWFVVPMTITAGLLAVLSVFVQVLVPQKFLGWCVMLLYVVASVALATAGFEHKLYDYGGMPPVPLSDMNRMGRFRVGQAWFQLYWCAFALVLAVLSYGLWQRGVMAPLVVRLRQLPRRLRGGAGGLLALGLLVWAGSGAFIYYNTNILNRYRSTPDREKALAQLERDLLPFASLPQPRVTGVTLDVQLFPREVRAVTTGSYRLENRSGGPIDALHLRWPERLRLDKVGFAGATLDRDYPEHHYRIYRLSPALAPGEVRTLTFATTLEERGFPNDEVLTRIVENGTFLQNSEITPAIGMSRDGLLKDRAKRRKYGLPLDLRPPTLEDEGGRAHNLLVHDSDWVDAELTLTTDADQVPVAPGEVVSDTSANGRRTLKSRTSAPINHFFSLQSARYAIARDRAGEIELAVYHHPAHAYNVDRMLAIMKESLALFTRDFGPYQFRQARVIEFPAYADYAQSFAGTIPYSETLGFLSRLAAPEDIDMVTYVTAHEIAHQWWGHQLNPSEQQGGTMLVESFAQYSALLVMEQHYGRDHVRRFLKYELDKYLRARGGEVVEELPLARVENQPYIHYQKGTLVMYWLREAIGEEVVNRALSRLLKEHAFRAAPYANTLDFLRILRSEAGPAHDTLITDLFEKITLYDVRTKAAHATRRADGQYEIQLEVEAHKFHADGQGHETEAPLDEPFEVGAFRIEPGKHEFGAASVIGFERQTLHSGLQTISFVVPEEPKFAGVDPYNKRIDRNSDDNLAAVHLR
jgi:ABC-type transport system involved in multi-copper enzyme maturation permease subunit